jgi:hypothetical protein
MRGESVLVVDFESDKFLFDPVSLLPLTVTIFQPNLFPDTLQFQSQHHCLPFVARTWTSYHIFMIKPH